MKNKVWNELNKAQKSEFNRIARSFGYKIDMNLELLLPLNTFGGRNAQDGLQGSTPVGRKLARLNKK